MDRNLYLLDPNEIKLIQDINTKRFFPKKPFKIMGENFTLQNVKDFDSSLPVDLVIVKNEGVGYNEVASALSEGIDVIRTIIEREREQREKEHLHNHDGEKEPFEREDWPRLGNFDDRDNPEPIFTDWDDDFDNDFPLYDNSPYEDWFSDYGAGRQCPTIEDNGAYVPSGRLNNYDLLQLDARIGQLKWRLMRLLYPSSSSVAKWSGSLLGLYNVKYDTDTFRVKSRTVYLLLDNIENLAYSIGVSRDHVLAEVYVHEMMHAYYDNIKTKNLVYAYLQGIPEIEEPLAEFGMLCFLSEFDPKYVPSAQADVHNKLISGDGNLQFYGLGEELFDKWYNRGLVAFSAPALSTYQKIMPAPRLSMSLVRKYRRAAHSSSFNPNLCIKMIYDIVDANDRNIISRGKHYLFDGNSYGYTNRMVYAVLDYYNASTHKGYPAMEADFLNRDPKFGQYHIFELESNINNSIVEKYDMKHPITLSDGSVIYPSRVWSSTPDGNTVKFLNQVELMYRRGLLNKSVNTLR